MQTAGECYREALEASRKSGFSEGFMPSLRRLRDALAEAGCLEEKLKLPSRWNKESEQEQG